MALARCDIRKLNGRTKSYAKSVWPLNYPDTSTICGRKDCLEPAVVWLDKQEERSYLVGERIFEIPNSAEIQIDMPNVTRRLKQLNQIFKV